jgi:predicted nucleotidyltransferase
LTKRDTIGRTGVFVHEGISIDANVEEELRQLARRNTFVKRRLMMK